jgi:CBS-domain-containing membrane protein
MFLKESTVKQGAAVISAFLGAFLTILALALTSELSGVTFLMAPFGASCVLLFAVRDSPFSRPKNIAGAYILSALIGIAVLRVFGESSWSLALGTALASAAMTAFRVIHPPAGALPLIIILGGFDLHYFLFPVISGTFILCVLGAALNRFVFRRKSDA